MLVVILVLELIISDRDFYIVLLLAVLIYLYAFLYVMRPYNIVRTNTRRMKENVHADECQMTTAFNDAGVVIHNHAIGAVTTIFYDDLKSLIEGDNYYFVITKAKQIAIVNKAVIDGANQKEALIGHLQNNCKNIEIRVKQKISPIRTL